MEFLKNNKKTHQENTGQRLTEEFNQLNIKSCTKQRTANWNSMPNTTEKFIKELPKLKAKLGTQQYTQQNTAIGLIKELSKTGTKTGTKQNTNQNTNQNTQQEDTKPNTEQSKNIDERTM